MKNTILLQLLFALLGLFLTFQTTTADVKVNLTPRPLEITEGEGSLVLPQNFEICCTLADTIKTEAESFAAAINKATNLNATVTDNSSALIKTIWDNSRAEEGYGLEITSEGISVKASTSAGFFYAFQSLKKILPANVMAGVKDDNVKEYSLPVMTINDEPRFEYRGFMLDVSRHFFTVEEVKRMIDVMAAYKMNRFHWHLTDDQGWRVEIKKYPKLTTVGATRANSWTVDMDYGDYWTNAQYGPYFYTQEEIADVVDYCHERHIKVIPEVDMPGHFVAAMASYPEYSCWPTSGHEVWINGGISSDVLNVGNPGAVQFAKNILNEIMDLFPDGYIHIGGDECPTSAWQGNAECKQRYQDLGLTDYRQLQSHFIKDISDHVKTRGYKMLMWNESITASGADLELMKETGATVMCWNPCQSGALKAAQMGMDNIVTEYHSSNGGYYINRKQWSGNEPTGAGAGDDTVEGCYNYVPVPSNVSQSLLPHYKGVQGTFWTEHVANRKYMEYLALPRLMAVAEAGWTPQEKKDFNDFRQRMMADTVMLNYNGYNYGRHSWASLDADTIKPEANKYYRLVTRATDARAGRCIELLTSTSPLVNTYSTNGAKANVLWTNTQASEKDNNYAYQQWRFEESTTQSGRYAIVCKTMTRGSVNPTPSATSVSGRWSYDIKVKNYSFVLGDKTYGVANQKPYFTIRSVNTNGQYMNASMSGQGFAVNLYSDPNSGNCGQWTFEPIDGKESEKSDFDQKIWGNLPNLLTGDTIRIQCNVEGLKDICIADTKGNNYLTQGGVDDNNTRWVVVDATEIDSTYSQTFKLKNCATNRFFGKTDTKVDKIGYPVKYAGNKIVATTVKLTYQPATKDYQLFIGDYNLYPVSPTSTTKPGIISGGSTVTSDGLAIRPQGAAWIVTGDGLTGIRTTKMTENKSTATYNLLGQRINEPQKGAINIVNGKKIATTY